MCYKRFSDKTIFIRHLNGYIKEKLSAWEICHKGYNTKYVSRK